MTYHKVGNHRLQYCNCCGVEILNGMVKQCSTCFHGLRVKEHMQVWCTVHNNPVQTKREN